MGKNSYLGGSTILNAGSNFFSKDRNSKRARVINAEKDFLLRCVRAELKGQKFPNSYAEHDKLRTAITQKGSVESWLKDHPDYPKIKERETKKQEKYAEDKAKKKKKSADLKNKKEQNKQKQEQRQLSYLKNYIWAQIVEREPPKNKPKGFSKKYQTDKELHEWAVNHEQFAKIYKELSQKREKQLKRIAENQSHSVEVIYKNTKKD